MGLGQIERPQFSATHAEWLADVRYEWIGFAQSLGPQLAIGVDAALVHTGDIPRTIELSAGGFKQDGTFNYNNLVIRIAVGSRVYEGVRVGAAFQIDQQEVDFGDTKQPVPQKKVRGNSVNLGIIYEPPIQNLRLGASLQNIGSQMPAFIDKPSSLPRILRIGGAYTIDTQPPIQTATREETLSLQQLSAQNHLILAVDFNFPS